jgi:lipopolysaccharide export system ATP-binding protein
LSAGERRRLELLRCLLAEPRALICDEPFAGVDPKNSAILAGLLRAEADRGMAVVFADHHVEEALGLCTRAALLLDGTVAAEGFPAEFRQNPLVSVRYLGTWRRTIPPSSVPDPPAP